MSETPPTRLERWLTRLRGLALILLAAVGLAPAPLAQDPVRSEVAAAPERVEAAVVRDAEATVQPTTRPFLWRIEGEVPSYLFGTIHIPDPRVTTLPDNVQAALDSVDGLFVEIPMDMGSMGRAAAATVLPAGETLRDVLPPALHERVDSYLQKRGSSIRGFEKFQVWAVDQVLVGLDLAEQMAAGMPLDMQLWALAGERGIDRGGLETIEEQLDVFQSLTTEQQIRMLELNIEEYETAFDEGRSLIGDLTEIYLQGNLEDLEDEMGEFLEEDEELSQLLERKLLTDRNLRMTERIIETLEDNPGKSYFFAVGAAHYPGRFGLLNLLELEGFETERLLVEDEAALPVGID